ncbi:MAG: InlB B-repeat-containing protein [Chthoniobacterales bacterium]
MKTSSVSRDRIFLTEFLITKPFVCGVLALAAVLLPNSASAQLQLANPNWNITLTSFGYADLLFDNTPGFEGREYLSGEWGAAISYDVSGGGAVTPQWFETNFIYPDWTTNSTFHVVSAIAQTGLNAANLPIAQSVIANANVEVTLRYEMLDTIVGTPMGLEAASLGGAGNFTRSNRYVLKQTYTIRNTSAATLANVQLFQFVHGLNSQRGVYDNRAYAGPLNSFRYDTTLAGIDAFAVGAGAGLEDFITFHSSVAPTALEIGHYGIEGNGVDNHGIGKPSDGVHLSVEDNWQTPPFSTRQGTEAFNPPQRWVAGAQRWALGTLPPGGSTSFDVVLSILTGTRVPSGPSIGDCDGGPNVPGGVHYEFEDVSVEGSFFSEFARADENELAVRVADGDFGPLTFTKPGMPAQIWETEFSGTYNGIINLTFGYDATLLPTGFDENTLVIYHFTGGNWIPLTSVVNAAAHTISFTTTTLGAFALGVDSGTTFTINTSASPANGGSVSGGGVYPPYSSVTLVATPASGYAFVNWTEGVNAISNSPSLTFSAQTDRTLVANFIAAGANLTISTSSNPANGGTTSGDGVYANGVHAVVVATPNSGYKFSKWLENGASVSTAASYGFTVAGNRALVARFKPVITLTTIADPPAGGEIDADKTFDPGDLAILIAHPNSGYAFVNWTENGVVVSDESTFKFNINGNRTLVGHFAPGYRIDVLADPKSAGVVTGGGVYDFGVPATVMALAKDGYVFLSWSEAGIAVSTSASYTFTPAANRTLVANLAALPHLDVAASTASITLSWPAGASGWILQESTDLSLGSWMDSTRTIDVVGDQNQVTVLTSLGQGFFRLAHP